MTNQEGSENFYFFLKEKFGKVQKLDQVESIFIFKFQL